MGSRHHYSPNRVDRMIIPPSGADGIYPRTDLQRSSTCHTHERFLIEEEMAWIYLCDACRKTKVPTRCQQLYPSAGKPRKTLKNSLKRSPVSKREAERTRKRTDTVGLYLGMTTGPRIDLTTTQTGQYLRRVRGIHPPYDPPAIQSSL